MTIQQHFHARCGPFTEGIRISRYTVLRLAYTKPSSRYVPAKYAYGHALISTSYTWPDLHAFSRQAFTQTHTVHMNKDTRSVSPRHPRVYRANMRNCRWREKSVAARPRASRQTVWAGECGRFQAKVHPSFTAKCPGNSSGTRGSILKTVVFIWRLNLAAASPPASARSSRLMDIVLWKLQQKHNAQLIKPPLWEMRASDMWSSCFRRYISSSYLFWLTSTTFYGDLISRTGGLCWLL